MNIVEMLVFVAYFLFMLGIGVFFFLKSKDAGEKDYFLGGRNMGAWVSALSAGASDMSAWVLMGLPASIYAFGIGQTWIAIGLGIGYALSWIFEAPRLRRFSIAAKDSITIPQYLTNRFLEEKKTLQVLCAVIFLVAYTVYAASSIKACGTLFNTVMNMDATAAMYLAAFIIISYTGRLLRRVLDGLLPGHDHADCPAAGPHFRPGSGRPGRGRGQWPAA